MLKTVRIGAWIAVAILASALIFNYYGPDKKPVLNTQLASFDMQNVDGSVFKSEMLKGKPYAIFFGYTHCPDVCPTTLFEMSQWIKTLGDAAKNMHFIYITVDPKRDTAEHLSLYLQSFSPQIIGLTGTNEQAEVARHIYHVYAKKVDGSDPDNYTMDHSASIMLYNRAGQFEGTIAYGENGDTAVKKLRRLIM